jgi:GxxExxY protein
LKVEHQKEFEVYYFNKRVGYYRIDLLIDDKVIIEVKIAREITTLHQAQLKSE